MLRFLKGFFGKPVPPDVTPKPEPTAPYKVETPVQPEPAKCGCGRSQSGLCVGLHKLTAEEWAAHESNPNAVKPAPAAEAPKPVAKKAPAKKKPAAMKAPAKPKAPRKPKATK